MAFFCDTMLLQNMKLSWNESTSFFFYRKYSHISIYTTISNGITAIRMHLLEQSTCASVLFAIGYRFKVCQCLFGLLKQQIIEWTQWTNIKMFVYAFELALRKRNRTITKQIQLFCTMHTTKIALKPIFFSSFSVFLCFSWCCSASIHFRLCTGHGHSHTLSKVISIECSDIERATIIHIIRCCCPNNEYSEYETKVDTHSHPERNVVEKLNSLKCAISWWIKLSKLCGTLEQKFVCKQQ